MRSLSEHTTAYEMINSNRVSDLASMLVKLRCKSGSGLMRVKQVCNLTAMSPFPSAEYVNYVEYFSKTYSQPTLDPSQPLVECEHIISPGYNYLLRSGQVAKKQKTSKSEAGRLKCLHFIGEHLDLIPFGEKEIAVLMMIPNVYHRLNCLLRTRKFQKTMEREIVEKLKIPPKVFCQKSIISLLIQFFIFSIY